MPFGLTAPLSLLVLAQFLSAFADNALLFTLVAMVMQQQPAPGAWYVPALQSTFLLAFVLGAPLAGYLSNHSPKKRILILANLLKLGGASALLLGLEPLFAYAIVGLGATLYSPAKYGILPEMCRPSQLISANSWVEASTILAILLGGIAGGMTADRSLPEALTLINSLFLLSAITALFLPDTRRAEPERIALGRALLQLLALDQLRPTLIALSLFWAVAASLRMILMAWAPATLGLDSAGAIAGLTLFQAIGIILGSGFCSRCMQLERLGQVRITMLVISVTLAVLTGVHSLSAARWDLLVMGSAAGLLLIPLNAQVQHQGAATVGSGMAVAVQNLLQNLAMLLGVGSYTLAVSQGASSDMALMAVSFFMLLGAWRCKL